MPLEYADFISMVQQWTGASREIAERATRATFETLADRLTRGDTAKLAAQLPPEFVEPLFTTTPAERLDVDEFVRRLADREHVDLATAEQHARGVFAALRRAVSEDEFAHLLAALPE